MAIPDRYQFASGDIELNANRAKRTFKIVNTGDRAIQVGSHYHLFEANRALWFDRVAALGMHLDLPAGTAVRFEPGETHEVRACAYGGLGFVAGFGGLVQGGLRSAVNRQHAIRLMRERGFLDTGETQDAGFDRSAASPKAARPKAAKPKTKSTKKKGR
jgi:urease subunit beta